MLVSVVVTPLVSVLGGCEVTEAGLVALVVVEDLDELEYVGVHLGACGEPDRAADPGDLDFEVRPECLQCGVAIGVAGRFELQLHVGFAGGERELQRRVPRAVVRCEYRSSHHRTTTSS